MASIVNELVRFWWTKHSGLFHVPNGLMKGSGTPFTLENKYAEVAVNV
jgi:hypothetical protein